MRGAVREPRLDAAPAEPVGVVLALGSNLGDRESVLASAVAALRAEHLDVTAVSPAYETPPVGGPEQPPYLNAVLLARTTLSPRAVLRAAHRVEDAHGRVRVARWGPRTLDVDVIAYGDLVASDGELSLPHPRAHERAFVLVPWAAADPTAVLAGPGGGPVAELAGRAADAPGVHRRGDVVLGEPT